MTMKIFNFILFYGFVISTADDKLYKAVKLSIIPKNDKPIIIHLNKVKSFLANENLPIWTIEDAKLHKLNSKQIMDELGPFSMFQNRDTSSAAVYFQKRFEFDGVIDVRYIIKGLHIGDDFNDQLQWNDNVDEHPIIERKEWGHLDETLTINKKLIIPKYYSKWIDAAYSKIIDKSCSVSHDNYVNYYIEVLIMINYDMTQQLMNNIDDEYTPLISYLLTLFNNVDMLFSKLDKPKININIAGVIIGHERNSFPFLTGCYKSKKINQEIIIEMNAECTDNAISRYLNSQRDTIPIDSYDIVIFLTRFGLKAQNYNKNTGRMEVTSVGGLTAYPRSGIYEFKKKHDEIITITTFMDDENFVYYPNVAHEIVHAIGVSDHDEEPCNVEYDKCNYKIMKQYVGFCKDCLSWSAETRKLLKKIFTSPDGCIFKNMPQSLHPNSPRHILTADEQCQCFGYKSAKKSQSHCKIIADFCKTHLQCKNGDGTIHDTLLPMDGTPCNTHSVSNVVCWNRECVEIKNMA